MLIRHNSGMTSAPVHYGVVAISASIQGFVVVLRVSKEEQNGSEEQRFWDHETVGSGRIG